MKKTLFRGSGYALAGVIIIFISGSFTYLEHYSYFGFIFFIIGLALITLGLLPYKKLHQIEIYPDILELKTTQLIYLKKGKPQLSIPIKLIKELSYFENNKQYGICLRLHQCAKEKIFVLEKKFNVKNFLISSPKKDNLFFPYFSQTSLKELEEEVLEVNLNENFTNVN